MLLKNALLLGVQFSYGAELVAVHAPPSDDAKWSAWAQTGGSTATHQTAGGVLGFKPNKQTDYTTGVGQGKCNQLQVSELDSGFALASSTPRPPSDAPVRVLEFDALLLAEGEWSKTCSRLGVGKSIDKFTQAIGLVINLLVDPKEPKYASPLPFLPPLVPPLPTSLARGAQKSPSMHRRSPSYLPWSLPFLPPLLVEPKEPKYASPLPEAAPSRRRRKCPAAPPPRD